jgi:urea transporter
LTGKDNILFFSESIINSYTQIFFSKNRVFGVILIATTFFDPGLGLSGLIAIIVSNLIALWLGFDKSFIREGSYGFNSLLVGLGLGLFYQPNLPFFVILIIAALVTVFLTIIISGVLAKYSLPYLSIPFLFGIWSILLASRSFEALGLSHKGVYLLNELYATGDVWLVAIYEWLNRASMPEPLMIYFKSLGAILFQFNILSGILMAAGLLLFSRIAFSLSLISFITAYYFYQFIGADIDALSYSYIGFNFILSGIALGSFFLVPSKESYLWSIILVPPLVVLTASLGNLFVVFQLGIYSLPFNIVVITFLYVLKLRTKPKKLEETVVQLYSPEKNLYERVSNKQRYFNYKSEAIGLPVFGEWFISQGHNGEHTHKEGWRHAWDFVMVDKEQQQFKGDGDFREDYLCFGKPVIAPADGVVESVADGIEDNDIGDANLYQNWGNTVVIKHGYQLFSQLSHLKMNSLKVKKGDEVKRGDVIGHCGNSGRSPYPHLHFQIQKTPHVGSKTMEYPISTYLRRTNGDLIFKYFDFPPQEAIVKSIESTKLLTAAFRLIPGKILKFKVTEGGETREVTWEIQSDILNNSYILCQESQSKAYFVNDGQLHYFTFFEGKKNSLLYYFFIAAYKVVLGYYQNLVIEDQYPLYLLASPAKRFLHDLTAPFFQYMSGHFRLEYQTIDDELAPENIKIGSSAELKTFNNTTSVAEFSILIGESRICEFEVRLLNKKIIAICTE